MVSGTATGYLIAGFAASTVLVFLMLRVGRALNLMAVPNARSSHVVPTPTAGGLGFVIPLLVFFGMLYLDGVDVALGLLLSLVLVAAASLWDDFAELSAGLRFACQTAAVALIVWQLDLPWAWYLLGLTGLALLWHVNLFNFMDGIDGIAAGQCLLYVVGVQVLTLGTPGWMGELCWLLAGSMLGFLAYNWPPAKIFMGDVGSGFLGAALALWSSWQVSTAIGVFLGAQIPSSWSLDFTLALTFIAIVVPALKDRPSVLSAISASIVAVGTANLPYKLNLIIAAVVGIAIGLWSEGGQNE